MDPVLAQPENNDLPAIWAAERNDIAIPLEIGRFISLF